MGGFIHTATGTDSHDLRAHCSPRVPVDGLREAGACTSYGRLTSNEALAIHDCGHDHKTHAFLSDEVFYGHQDVLKVNKSRVSNEVCEPTRRTKKEEEEEKKTIPGPPATRGNFADIDSFWEKKNENKTPKIMQL